MSIMSRGIRYLHFCQPFSLSLFEREKDEMNMKLKWGQLLCGNGLVHVGIVLQFYGGRGISRFGPTGDEDQFLVKK